MNVRSLPSTAAALVIAASILPGLSPGPAQAHGGYRGHGGFGGPRIGVFIGAPIVPFHYGPRYYYSPPVYFHDYPPVVRVVPAPPVFYIERGDAQAPSSVPAPSAPPSAPQPQPQPPVQSAQPQAAQGPEWFFCNDSNTYYPYVRECATPWQRMPAQPPAGAR